MYDIEVTYFGTNPVCIHLNGVANELVDTIYNLLSQVSYQCDIYDIPNCVAYQK